MHAAEQDRPDVAQQRQQWKDPQPAQATSQLIFIDETLAKTNMMRLRGRAPVGERLVSKIAALDTASIRCSTVVDGRSTADVFEAFVRQVLVPQLHAGDVVVMDNLSSHKRASIAALIEAAGAFVLFLPPYSPDFDPIGMIFAKIKQLLRTLARRTREALWTAMQSVLDRVSTEDAAHCFRHCGYTLQLD